MSTLTIRMYLQTRRGNAPKYLPKAPIMRVTAMFDPPAHGKAVHQLDTGQFLESDMTLDFLYDGWQRMTRRGDTQLAFVPGVIVDTLVNVVDALIDPYFNDGPMMAVKPAVSEPGAWIELVAAAARNRESDLQSFIRAVKEGLKDSSYYRNVVILIEADLLYALERRGTDASGILQIEVD